MVKSLARKFNSEAKETYIEELVDLFSTLSDEEAKKICISAVSRCKFFPSISELIEPLIDASIPTEAVAIKTIYDDIEKKGCRDEQSRERYNSDFIWSMEMHIGRRRIGENPKEDTNIRIELHRVYEKIVVKARARKSEEILSEIWG